jgi:hypothetical protein
MLAIDIRRYIIVPALKITDTWSESAEILVYGTGWVESQWAYTRQIGNVKNGGYGFYSDEPADYKDIGKWLNEHKQTSLKDRILAACYYMALPLDIGALEHNIKLATLICRCHYLRIPEALPAANDAPGMARYHKKYYNSMLGATDPAKSTVIFKKVIDGVL